VNKKSKRIPTIWAKKDQNMEPRQSYGRTKAWFPARITNMRATENEFRKGSNHNETNILIIR